MYEQSPLQDPRTTEALAKSLAEVVPLRKRYHDVVAGKAAPGSRAAADLDNPIGQLVWILATQAWAVGSDHALAWNDLLTKAHAQPMRAHASLLRGAIEGAVTCRHLVDPTADQPERLRRAASLQLADHRERANFERSTGFDKKRLNPPAKHAAQRATDLVEQMKRLGVARIEASRMTTLCARYSAGDWLYQLLSAFAHGKPWALLASELSQVQVPIPPGTPGGVVTARDDLSLLATMHAMEALRTALHELEAYAGR